MSFTPISAKNAQVRINGNTLIAKKWTIEPDTDELDVSNFEAGGYDDHRGGLLRAKVTIEFDFDGEASGNCFDAPLALAPGAFLTNVRLYWNTTGGPYFSFPLFLVSATPADADVKGTVKGSLRGKNKGVWAYPTGAFGTN